MQNERAIKKSLSPKQAILFVRLKHGRPMDIPGLFAQLWPGEALRFPTLRDKQQRLGPVVSGLNKVLCRHDLKVVPGKERGTYQLARIREIVIIK